MYSRLKPFRPYAAAVVLALIEWGLQVSGISSLPLAIGLWGLAGVIALGAAYHDVREWVHNRTTAGNPAVEPWHLIATGLTGVIIFSVVALIGVVWHFNSNTGKAQAGSGTVTASHIQLGSEPSGSAKPLKHMLTAYGVEQRLRAIDDLYAFLNDKLLPVSGAGEKLSIAIHNKISNGTAIEALDQYAEQVSSVLADFYNRAAKYMYLGDIYTDAISTTDWSPQDVAKSASLLRAELQELKQRNVELTPDLLRNNKLLFDFKTNMSGKFWTWINQKKEALARKRRQYEQAEVYPR